MYMEFNFNSLANTSFTSDAQNYLKAYEIYKVRLTKFEKSELNGKDGVTTYPVIAVEFTGEDGIFNENIFIPIKDDDFERKENTNHKLMPSRFDRFQFTLMQIVEAINPTGAEKIKAMASKLRTIDDFITVVTKALAGKDTEVYLKLVGQNTNGKLYSRLPNSCFMGKDNKPVASNFISQDRDKLFFTNYEIGEMNKYKNARPTNMDVQDIDNDTEEAMDLDGIDL